MGHCAVYSLLTAGFPLTTKIVHTIVRSGVRSVLAHDSLTNVAMYPEDSSELITYNEQSTLGVANVWKRVTRQSRPEKN